VKKNKLSLFAVFSSLYFFPIFPAFGQSEYVSHNDRFIEDIDVNFFSDARVRYQSISQGNLENPAEALTFRVKAGLEFNISDWVSALVELEGGDALIDDFNDTVNGRLDVPIIPDRGHLELNRLQIQSEIKGLRLTLGRQNFALDNWRFLGNWQFRQNDQTYDAARVETGLWGGRLNIGYIDKVHRHFGDDSVFGEFSGSSYIFNYVKPALAGQFSIFHYALDLETGTDLFPNTSFSSVTSGARWHGRRHWGDYGFNWDLSVARQSDFANNPNQFEAYYRDVGVGLEYKNLEINLGIEILGSDNGVAVQTPLGTLHEFQGVTDRFFLTPPQGLRDYGLDIDWDLGRLGVVERVKFNTGFHQFTSDQSVRDYGYEFNLGISGRVKNTTLLLEYGTYKTQAIGTDQGLFTNDAQALILSANYSFD
jgi:hypothetical protein